MASVIFAHVLLGESYLIEVHWIIFQSFHSHGDIPISQTRDLFSGTTPGVKRSSSSGHDKLQSSYRLRRAVHGSIVDAIALRAPSFTFTPPAARLAIDSITWSPSPAGVPTQKNSITGGRPGYFLVALYARIYTPVRCRYFNVLYTSRL